MALFRRPTPPSPAPAPGAAPDALQIALGYHQRSKHHLHRYAASLGYLDWDSQPEPFRRWEGAPRHPLPLPPPDQGPGWEALHRADGTTPAPLGLASLSRLLFHSLALSAWKRLEQARWALRVNPSSGNLHPTEGYLLLPSLPELGGAPVCAHYAPDEHALEARATFGPAMTAALASALPPGAFLVGLSSIPWRESWKYGERAWRYCQHDVGHALAALAYGASLLGWRLRALPDVDDGALATLLGLDRSAEQHEHEEEVPDLLAVVLTGGAPQAFDPGSFRLDAALLEAAREGSWAGRANRLSVEHHPWDVIAVVEHACRKGPGREQPWLVRARPDIPQGSAPARTAAAGAGADGDPQPDAATLIRRRRSAVAFDGRTSLSREAFLALLARTLPEREWLPWASLPWPTFVHLLLFVHRVEGLEPGLYAFIREAQAAPRLRSALRDGFLWEPVADGLPLWLLHRTDARATARTVSCHQEIAADSAFSLAMVAEFAAPLGRWGAPLYRHLFWETGAVGQALYLGAEAAGVRATGIGCFFDDAVHQVFGLSDDAFQSLYHFTVGGAVDDPRLTTEPAYPALATPR